MQPNNYTPERPDFNTEARQPLDLERSAAAPAENSPPTTPPPEMVVSATTPPPIAPPPSPLESLAQVADTDDISDAWVNQAETIMETQAQDPYTEEQQSATLSRDYLKQKFGLDVDKT